jgi:hypothetical protein
MRKFRIGKFTSGKYEVNLRKHERQVYIYQWQNCTLAKWQLGREQLHEARILHASQRVISCKFSNKKLVNLRIITCGALCRFLHEYNCRPSVQLVQK